MTVTSEIYSNAIISTNTKDLKDIHQNSKNIGIYNRDITHLKETLRELSKISVHYQSTGTTDEIGRSLDNYLDMHLDKPSSILEDIQYLLQLFESISTASQFRLSLETVSTNMCRRFHADYNVLRLLCTYMGDGTLWLPDQAIDFVAYHKGKCNDEIVKDEHLIQQIATGSVCILKGAKYADDRPILHRSPNIENKSSQRILLRIDAINI